MERRETDNTIESAGYQAGVMYGEGQKALRDVELVDKVLHPLLDRAFKENREITLSEFLLGLTELKMAILRT